MSILMVFHLENSLLSFIQLIQADRINDCTTVSTLSTTRYGNARPPTFTRPRATKFQKSVTYQAPSLWAALPNGIKNENDRCKFDIAFKKIVEAKMATLNSIYLLTNLSYYYHGLLLSMSPPKIRKLYLISLCNR